ncbi:MAG: fumarate hydratase [Dehalococcoidales bacterium]|nr:fumarate hydratase [Dehalococcoidales bacterium]MDP6449110.1 fumarate hydratase [Dehalococcoidales bacterium]MDP6824662.1 fumarate hydratase [Dehalococcoidales bacterium]
MREIKAAEITEAVARLCQQVNFELGDDVLAALKEAQRNEASSLGREILGQLIENAGIAQQESLPLCQDCGVAVVFLEVGQDVHVTGGDLSAAVIEGVRWGYTQGYLRKSMVNQPFSARKNTGDNTPPVIHTEIVPGNRLKISYMAKGAGSENMSRLAMLKPAEGREGLIEFVVRTVDEAGANACPPLVIGLGIGATAEGAMRLAKKALLRRIGEPNPDLETVELESELLSRINGLGIGPLGLGGSITALAVQAEVRPTHIASLPVAVNIQCHSARHGEVVL